MSELLDLALRAHGGLSRWREIEAFQLKVSIGGGLSQTHLPARSGQTNHRRNTTHRGRSSLGIYRK